MGKMCLPEIAEDVVVSAENINFCPGPCNDTTPEPPPRMFGREAWHAFKPRDGGRYQSLHYPMPMGGRLILKNVRMCYSCYKRHMEFEDEGCVDYSIRDCERLMDKLKKLGCI